MTNMMIGPIGVIILFHFYFICLSLAKKKWITQRHLVLACQPGSFCWFLRDAARQKTPMTRGFCRIRDFNGDLKECCASAMAKKYQLDILKLSNHRGPLEVS